VPQLCRNPIMSHHPAPYGTAAPADKLPFTPLYRLPTAIEQATWSEDRLQQECCLWCQATYPAAYRLLFAVPNGGKRSQAEAAKFVATGVKAGVPDLMLAMPYPAPLRGIYAGLFIELKTRTGRVAPAQTAWHAALRQQGYRVEVVRSLPEFIDLLTQYLA